VLLLEGVIAEAGSRRVLDRFDLAVPRGDCFAVVGSDPAVLRVLVDLLTGHRRPAAGRVRIDGLDPVSDVEVLDGRVVVDAGASNVQPPDLGRADVWLVLDERTDAEPGDRDALLGRLERCRRGPHRTVLLATADRALAATVGDRFAALDRGRLVALDPRPSHPLLEGGAP
jgi:ABC-2 type transport system ATP-binding protein